MNITKRIVPRFATESEEAEWWYQNRDIHDQQLAEAVRNGEAQILTKEKLLARIEASKKTPAPSVSLRIPEGDLALRESKPKKRGCRTRPTSNRYCTRRSPSAKSRERDELIAP